MKNAKFLIHHENTELTETGIDRIQFLFSANANISPQNITKVASGGELSRLMLAIKYNISKAAGLPTIIFDEIDAGVSGEIADKVGRLIKEMASGMQVINITHLPQVASKGDEHFLVYKEAVNGTTKTRIRRLSDDERLNEIARMLSGDSVTHAAIENAKVLLGR
jgi:DNA repair protein RecN (Recombination protein N)